MFRWVVGLSLAVLLCCAGSDRVMAAGGTRAPSTQPACRTQSSRHPQAPGVANPARALRRQDESPMGRPRRSRAGQASVRHPLHHVPRRRRAAAPRSSPRPCRTNRRTSCHHFHLHPGDGDAYLFWRVSQGGTVEPFKSAGSLMPAFDTVLSDDQIWDVLAFVCAEYHLGFE